MTKMIREHFNLIAKAFNLTKPNRNPDRVKQWTDDVEQVANVLSKTNERFDKDRFIKACNKGEQ